MKSSFKYTQGTMQLDVHIKPYVRHGNAYADIDFILWNGTDVYYLLESFDCLADIEAEAERRAEELLAIPEIE